jgi:hypothetical protein
MVLRCPPNIINVYIVTCSMIMYTMSSSTMTVQHKSEIRQSDYPKQPGKSLPITDFFNAISDDKSLTIFNTVALNAGKTGILISTIGITRKQFYSKMERFMKLGLLVRREGNYYLTSLGKIMYQLQGIFGLALNNYWKLRAIDSLQTPGGLPEFEVNKLIDSLLENQVLKNLIVAKVN